MPVQTVTLSHTLPPYPIVVVIKMDRAKLEMMIFVSSIFIQIYFSSSNFIVIIQNTFPNIAHVKIQSQKKYITLFKVTKTKTNHELLFLSGYTDCTLSQNVT